MCENRKEDKAYVWNHRHRVFIEENGCFKCEMFCDCSPRCGDADFKCPMDDVESDGYKEWTHRNFVDLCDVVSEPSQEEWDSVRTMSKIGVLEFEVVFPYVKTLDTFLKKTCVDDKPVYKYGSSLRCKFNAKDLRSRLVTLRKYTRDDSTVTDVIADGLEELLVPLKSRLLFKSIKFNGGEK